MKLTKTQKEFIDTVLQVEERLGKKLWLRMTYDGKYFMGTHDDDILEVGFGVHGRTVKSLTDKEIVINAEFQNKWGSTLTGMTLSDEYRLMQIV